MGRFHARRTLLLAFAVLAATGVGIGVAVHLTTSGREDAARSHEPDGTAPPSAVLLSVRARAALPGKPTTASEATARIRISVGGRFDKSWPGEPIAGATVRIGTRSGAERVAVTPADGRAVFEGLPAGEVHVSVTAPGYANARDYWFTLKPNEDRDIGEHLDPAETLRGKVLDAADGRPVDGAVVTAFEGGSVNMNPAGPPRVERAFGAATTDALGRFAVEGVARDEDLPFSLRIVRVQAHGYRTQWRIVSAQTGTDGVVVRVQLGGTLEGVVQRADGAPAAGATVLAMLDDDGAANPLWDEEYVELPARYGPHSFGPAPSFVQDPTQDAWAVLRVTADETGHFAVTGLGLGERYAVAARADGLGSTEITRGVVVSRETPVYRADLRLRAAHRLTVHVLDIDRRACADFSVHVGGLDRPTQTDTDASGVASFDALPPGTYPVRVRGFDEWHTAPDAVISDSDVEVVAQLDRRAPATEPRRETRASGGAESAPPPTSPAPRTPTLLARIAVAEGTTPPKFVRVRGLKRGGSAGGDTDWKPDASGAVPLAWTLDWPAYVLSVDADGFLPIVREVRGAPVDLGTIELSPGRTLEGEIVATVGAMPSQLAVRARFQADGKEIPNDSWYREDAEPTFERVGTTDAAGKFRIAGLPEGRVSLSVDDSRFLGYKAVISVPPPQTPFRFSISPGGVARVHVETADGYPASRRQVTIEPVNGERVSGSHAYGETDIGGGFAARLPPGTYNVRLSIRSADGAGALPPSVQAVVTLEEGETQNVRLVAPPR